MSETFGSRFHAAADRLGSFCLGIDPGPEILSQWGLADDPGGLSEFCKNVADWCIGEIAIAKPQSAYFERYGSRGIAVLETLIATLRRSGVLVLLDAKRGDIGSTSDAYGFAYFHPDSPLRVDAMTAHPYLGFGSLRPMLERAARVGGCVFVVAASSNDEGIPVQQARMPDGRAVVRAMFEDVARFNLEAPTDAAGVVVGATRTDIPGADLQVLGRALVLCPGIGAQGADIGAITRWPNRRSLIPTASRSVLRCGRDKKKLVANLRANVAASKALRA